MPKSALVVAMRRTPGRLLSLARQVMALASIQGCGRVEYRTYGVSIVGEYGKGGWFERGGVDPLSWGFSARLAPSLASSVG